MRTFTKYIIVLLVLSTSLTNSYSNIKGETRTFYLVEYGNPYNPLHYSQCTPPTAECPGFGKISVIEVPMSDVYHTGKFAGKPKVDLRTKSKDELSDDIATALSNFSNPTFLHGRTIWEQN